MHHSLRWTHVVLMSLALLAVTGGAQVTCSPASDLPSVTGDGSGNSNAEEVLDENPGDPPDNGGTPADDTPNDDSGNSPANGSPVIRGRLALAAPGAASQAVHNPAGREVAFEVTEGCVVVAVSNVTQQIYRATVDAAGAFELDLPDSEAGNTLMITILGPDGKPLGPVLVGTADGKGLTGLRPEGDVDLGTIEVPGNLGDGPIAAGADANIPAGSVDAALDTRVDANGVPVGVNNFGKGQDARSAGAAGNGIDADKDGLVDLFDADDDGNGRVDDLESGASAWELPPGADARANFFTNLKIQVEDADVYYHGTQEEIDAAISRQTVITFECMTEPIATRNIIGAHLLSSPAPSYLPLTTVTFSSAPWSASGYAFNPSGDRYDVFVVPNAVMSAGDTFTVEVAFDNGTTEQYSRMLNYILKNIPRLVNYGAPGAPQAYDPGTAPYLGAPSNPVLFDGTQPLVLEFNPPVDETGAYLEGFDYSFQIFFSEEGGAPIDFSNVDKAATWPTPIPGLDNSQYYVHASDASLATLSADHTYTVEIPAAVLPSQLVMNGGTTKTVGTYKIDITACCPSGNSAICLVFARQ